MNIESIAHKVAEIKEAAQTSKRIFDPDKRIDVTKRLNETKYTEKPFNPDKRLAPQVKEISAANLLDKYTSELKKYSEVPSTLKDMKINPKDLKAVSPEEVKIRRKEFSSQRNNLIKEWESVNGKEWPTYKKDMYDEYGHKVKEKGMRYDAHHKQPLCLGGKNEVSNITPLRYDDHRMIHASGGSLDQLTKRIQEARV